MRNYLFIDLHIHSVHSFETDCDATPEEILENTLATVKKVQNSMIERVNECVAGGSEEELDKLLTSCLASVSFYQISGMTVHLHNFFCAAVASDTTALF